jgi:hypothetical protein
LAQIDQQILGAPPHPQNLKALQIKGVASQGPAQSFTQIHSKDLGASDRQSKALSGNFNFG